MRAVVAYPGIFQDAQQAALAFHERYALAAFVTGVAFHEQGALLRRIGGVPGGYAQRLSAELRRRAIAELPAEVVVSYPWFEGLRTVLARYSTNPIFADSIWDLAARRFDRNVAAKHLAGIDAVYAFEYTAEATFERASRSGVARILALPSTDSKSFDDMRRREEARFPELRDTHQRYFAAKFARRYERRRREIALADLVVANSEVTRRSHIAAGADPDKIVAIPLAAPPPVASLIKSDRDVNKPLSVVWAGNISLGKGAHYFVEAWRGLDAGDRASARLYGRVALPDRALRPLPANFTLMGSVPRPVLFEAFDQADVLVFPTLADGFGMVVAEAFSRGLPVITTDKAGASQLVEHRRNGLIVPAFDSAAIKDALQWCLDNRAALYEMRLHAVETARRWQWRDYRSSLIALVERLLSEGHACGFDALSAARFAAGS